MGDLKKLRHGCLVFLAEQERLWNQRLVDLDATYVVGEECLQHIRKEKYMLRGVLRTLVTRQRELQGEASALKKPEPASRARSPSPSSD